MTTKKLSTKRINGVTHYYVDEEEVNSGTFQKTFANNHGYKNPYHMAVDKGYKKYKGNPEKYLLKEELLERPEGLIEIPSAPGYYATEEGVIWCYSNKRKAWIIIKSYANPHNHYYTTIQPYINNKRYIKYVHRLIAEAFLGEIPNTHEVNHIDHNVMNNHISNLEILPKDIHRSLKKARKNKN